MHDITRSLQDSLQRLLIPERRTPERMLGLAEDCAAVLEGILAGAPAGVRPELHLFTRIRHDFGAAHQLVVYELVESHVAAVLEATGHGFPEIDGQRGRRCSAEHRPEERCGARAAPGSRYCRRHGLPGLVPAPGRDLVA